MKRRVFPQPLLILLVLIPVLLACSLLKSGESPDTTPNIPVSPTHISPTKNSPTSTPPTATLQLSPTRDATKPFEAIRQWAIDVEASSEYGSTDWSAIQALGEPDTLECGDVETAWASEYQDTVEWINLYFLEPVYPSEIRIIETYNPDQVSQVDLIDMQGKFVTVYRGKPVVMEEPCPYVLSIPVKQDSLLVQGVRITIDQTVLTNWNEIDAVEIVGIPGEGTPVRPQAPTP